MVYKNKRYRNKDDLVVENDQPKYNTGYSQQKIPKAGRRSKNYLIHSPPDTSELRPDVSNVSGLNNFLKRELSRDKTWSFINKRSFV